MIGKTLKKSSNDWEKGSLLRLGLCCTFDAEPIRFRRTTARAVQSLPRREQLKKLSGLCLCNAEALKQSILFCAENGIGAFRINSQLFPLKTHPVNGYAVKELPESKELIQSLKACGRLAAKHGIRLSSHPDQFVVLSSADVGVTERSIAELAYQAEWAEWVGADVINLHGGGAYGNKAAALRRVVAHIRKLPKAIRSRLTLENDDRVYTPGDLLPVCRAAGVPLVYDVHHHRCNPDTLSVEEATQAALSTWNREPLFHLSSPKSGWSMEVDPRPHHDFIDVRDFPACWRGLALTVDVEAKVKERAVLQLLHDL